MLTSLVWAESYDCISSIFETIDLISLIKEPCYSLMEELIAAILPSQRDEASSLV
jgi:hypothetical protein